MALNRYPALLLLLIMVFTLNACSQKKENTVSSEEIGLADANRYLTIPDADSLLPDWSRENTIVNHWVGGPDNLHPTNGRFSARTWILSLTHNYLMRLDPVTMRIVPDLATDQPVISANSLEYTYTVRSDARWDDGSPVTAEDVLFTLRMNKCPLTNNASYRSLTENLQDVRIADNDPQTLTLYMHDVYVQNISFLSSFIIMQRRYHDPENMMEGVSFQQMEDTSFVENASAELIAFMNEYNDGKYGNDVSLFNGSGPYKVSSWERGANLILEKKPSHWSKNIQSPAIFQTAYADKIIFKEIKDDNAQILELKSQEIDATVWLSTQSLLTLEPDENFQRNYNYRYTDNFSFNYIGINTRPDGIRNKKFFDDKSVRQAMTYLVPTEQILEVIYNGKATVWPSFLSPNKDGFNDTLAPYHYDVAKAISMLEASGWKDTDGDNIRDKIIDGQKVDFSFELMYASTGSWIDQMAEMIKEAMYPAGVEVKLVSVDLSAMAQKVSTHEFDAYMSAWATNSLPDDYVQLWHTSSYINEGVNFCGFGNAYSDALIDSLNQKILTEDREPLIRELQALVYDEAPYLMYISPSRKNIIHKRLGNQVMTFERPGNMVNYLMSLGQGIKEME